MLQKIKDSRNLIRNMGFRYVRFRLSHELSRRTGMLKRKFPVSPVSQHFINLQQWKELDVSFFFKDKDALRLIRQPSTKLKEWFDNYQTGKLVFFGSTVFNLGKEYDWVTNPETSFVYDTQMHWTEIADYSKEAGDIKYVWEKSRFSFLYSIIRYDYHFEQDCSEMIFKEILSWIDHSPINCGPNYRCSQEISLRILNWIFALYYYKNAPALTEAVFQKIMHSIYWQINHVYSNINFSRIAVRNNHAITETMGLYLFGILFPFFPGASIWKKEGKKWFEQEVAYQLYPDGTYLQFSMNYHRVVIQLLTWAIVLAEKNDESFSPIVYERAKKSLEFLRTCMIDENGRLPNYGANDGALFFRLNNAEYRDYRPSLDALANALKTDLSFPSRSEDIYWYGLDNKSMKTWLPAQGINQFNSGGYYIIREADTLTFIRCGKHKDRPSQADNLHLDVWYKGENILMDAGSYKYNTDEETLRYFMGTASHNAVMLGDHDQMKKGTRFIWYNWTQCMNTELKESESSYSFKGIISAFKTVGGNILHTREIVKTKGKPSWIIKDSFTNKPPLVLMKQIWHLPTQHSPVLWKSTDAHKQTITGKNKEGVVSELYGKKEPCEMVIFQTANEGITTEFVIKH
jgi:Heparinase II/III-like protein/Heparinase II/III N-terminus